MKPRLLQLILLLSVFAVSPTSAREPAMSLFKDFAGRFEAAVGTRDVSAVLALYQTNGVSAAELAAQRAKWQRIFADDAPGKLWWYGKELATLPSEPVRKYWREYVEHLTTRQVTHVVTVRFGGGNQFILPLVSVEGKLWIVPAEKSSPRIEPDGAANRGQPIRSDTDSTSPAAASRR